MGRVYTYLNFDRETEKAFIFYRSVFGGDFSRVIRRGDVPSKNKGSSIPKGDKDLIALIVLPILDKQALIGTDTPRSLGFEIKKGNNIYIVLDTDTKQELEELFNALSEGGVVERVPTEMKSGFYSAACADKFGVQWMFSCKSTK